MDISTSVKTYRLKIKLRDPVRLTENYGEQVKEWWKRSRTTDKLDLHDDDGNYIETILSSQIEGIERDVRKSIAHSLRNTPPHLQEEFKRQYTDYIKRKWSPEKFAEWSKSPVYP